MFSACCMVTTVLATIFSYISKAVTTYRYSNSLFHVTSLQSIRRSKESSFLAYIMTLKVKLRQCFHVKK